MPPVRRANEATAPLLSDLIELGGAGVEIVDLDRGGADVPQSPGVIRIGVSRRAKATGADLDPFDILLSATPSAPRPWVGVEALDPALDTIADQVKRQPTAAAVAAQVLRMSLQVGFEEALTLESMAYSMLLAAGGFRAWRLQAPTRERADDVGPRVSIDEIEGGLDIRLTRPAARNAFDARMRDELTEALTFALVHPDAPKVELSGEGPAFSAGGDLNEFGQADDVGLAHLIRTLRSPARLAHALGDRLTARLHGACIGAGIEVPAAAGRVLARRGAFFRLPEVSMGLVPGAGGTVSIPRRIGRHRACYMAISGAAVDVDTALGWGLVDAIGDGP